MRKDNRAASLVLYAIIRGIPSAKGTVRFLVTRKQGRMTFPSTKFRPGEGLYPALVRPMEEDLGLPPSAYYPETELGMIPNEGESPRYPGLTKRWHLYPVDISLSPEAAASLKVDGNESAWWTLAEILRRAKEPNVLAIARYIKERFPELLRGVHQGPSMDAFASHWAAQNTGGVRHVKADDVRRILGAGSRAFNLRVADPYLPYQKQGLGFTWSFFTPRDKQDIHVHGLPAVEIYGVIEGRLQVWHKPMTERGVRTWRCVTLEAGDWLEVEPLHCHFAFWLEPEGLGTVFKAASSGELAGVGKIGIAGKTTCKDCNVQSQCLVHPRMVEILEEYSKPFERRNYRKICSLSECEGHPGDR
jgi:mannose-6-phosphate isomerase-like protein (cupin superfamily)